MQKKKREKYDFLHLNLSLRQIIYLENVKF